jgi:hypothetical protein
MSDPEPTTLAVDAMGGDRGPEAVVGGVCKACRADSALRVILFGRESDLAPLKHRLGDCAGRVEIRHADGVVSMDDKPRDALRNGESTSMGAALEAVARGAAQAALSLRQHRRAHADGDAQTAQGAGGSIARRSRFSGRRARLRDGASCSMSAQTFAPIR